MITRVQLREFAWSDRAIDLQIGRSLTNIHRVVFLVGGGELTDRARWIAAVLACGRSATLSHDSAAALWGLINKDYRTHVSVPRGRLPKHPGIEIHPRQPMPQPRFIEGIRVTSPLETLVDLAASRPAAELTRLTDEAARRRLIDLDDATEDVRAMRRRLGAKQLLAVLVEADRTDSDLEIEFLSLVRAAHLPEPRTQQEVLGFRVDFLWPDLQLVVETDGLTYHRTRAQQAKDRLRDQRLTAAGYTCLRFTDDQVARRPKAVISTLKRVMERLSSKR